MTDAQYYDNKLST